MQISKAYSLIALVISAILLFPQHSLASVTATTYIVGGDDVEREYPWMVALYNGSEDSTYGFTCGGVLISSRWIATAAHCVYEDDDADGNATAYAASNYKLVIGESTHYSTTSAAEGAGITVYSTGNIVINPNYDSESTDYDIALIELDSSYYQPGPAIATSIRFDSIEEGDLLTTIGYGYMSADEDATADEVIPTILQEADLPFVPTSECYWNDDNQITDNMFCAGYEDSETNIDSCNGDSGGPVFTLLDGELTLVGLVSWGASSCSDYPGVYTKVSNLRSWILDNIDGFQVVEEGTARYDSDAGSFNPGLISVYQYGIDSDSYLDIGSLSFDDQDYIDTLNVSDSCSDTYLYETDDNDANCKIEFELTDVINEDYQFDATLSVTPNESAGEQTYDLRFIAELVTDDDSSDDSSSSSSSGGSLAVFSLFLLALLSWWRIGLGGLRRTKAFSLK